MATINGELDQDRTELISEVISTELDRQAQAGAPRVNVAELAGAIEAAIEHPPAPALDEGKHPDELNSSNDD